MSQLSRGPKADVVARPQVDRIFDDQRHDPYAVMQKYAEPTACSGCGAVYRHGRWTWGKAPPGAELQRCPACQRAHDQYPAGHLRLGGPFVVQHRDQVLSTVHNIEAKEKLEHPLHRILAIEQRAPEVLVTTTDIHLPRRIAEALHLAHGGAVEFAYGENEYSLRAHWRG